MSSDMESRVRAALRTIAESPVIAARATPYSRVDPDRGAAAWRYRARRFAPALAALGVLVLVAVLTMVPLIGPGAGGPGFTPAGPAQAPILPSRFAGLSLLTATVSQSPPGPAIAVLRQGSVGTRWGSSQLLVVGADGRTYRRIDLAENRGSSESDGEWSAAPTLLSPDGRRLAVGSSLGGVTDLPILDLTTGERVDIRIDPPMGVALLDWSPDGRHLAVALAPAAAGQEVWAGPGAEDDHLALVDTVTGAITPVPGTGPLESPRAYFSPDGQRLAVVEGTWQESRLQVVARDGTVLHTIPKPAQGFFTGWTPDESAFILTRGDDNGTTYEFVDATGGAKAPPAPLTFPGERADLIGWRSPTTMLISITDTEGEDHILAEVGLDGSGRRTLSTFSSSPLGFGRVQGVAVAQTLIRHAQVGDEGVSRGPWPGWARGSATALLIVVVLVALLVRRWRRRRTAALSDDLANRSIEP